MSIRHLYLDRELLASVPADRVPTTNIPGIAGLCVVYDGDVYGVNGVDFMPGSFSLGQGADMCVHLFGPVVPRCFSCDGKGVVEWSTHDLPRFCGCPVGRVERDRAAATS